MDTARVSGQTAGGLSSFVGECPFLAHPSRSAFDRNVAQTACS